MAMTTDMEFDVDTAISLAAEELLYTPLKDEQRKSITQFMKGKDVFVILPTGFGKTVCYACLPRAFDHLKKKASNYSIVLVISPLTALMKDQVKALTEHGINAGQQDSDSAHDVREKVDSGGYNVLFMSPEMLTRKGREILSKEVYKERLVGLIIDEAHCVVKWGRSFRDAFLKIKEIRSITSNINVMALTATATTALRIEVEKQLGMQEPYEVILSPDKVNILYTVRALKGNLPTNDIFLHLLHELRVKRTSLSRVLIYCKNKTDCAELYRFFYSNMGSEFTEPPGAPVRVPECRLVDMFFKGTQIEVKNSIINNFTKPSSLRIVIATVAFGMGVNCPDVHLVIHVGPPNDIESYVQEVGRSGRNGERSYAILLHSKNLNRECSTLMTEYISKKNCRRDTLYQKFDKYSHCEENQGCLCCDICRKSCACGNCTDTLSTGYTFISLYF